MQQVKICIFFITMLFTVVCLFGCKQSSNFDSKNSENRHAIYDNSIFTHSLNKDKSFKYNECKSLQKFCALENLSGGLKKKSSHKLALGESTFAYVQDISDAVLLSERSPCIKKIKSCLGFERSLKQKKIKKKRFPWM